MNLISHFAYLAVAFYSQSNFVNRYECGEHATRARLEAIYTARSLAT